ncbi:PD40 domain-containing protein [Herbidospora daliensis]|uniref:PD40 domain-containing protein n=1 Tax=Herbidospora daliensis TaxID=295585 RepID=UPI0007861F5A|nr:PD40 domain-containing protein [Herbidospora daliensis]
MTTRMHDELARIAACTPDVDLADRVLRGARRRRARSLASAAVAAAVTVAVAITLTVIGIGPKSTPMLGAPVASPGKGELPVKGVGPAAYAYYDWCGEEITSGTARLRGRDCLQWRLVTRSGERYRVPEARAAYAGPTENDYSLIAPPMSVSADGRKIAYFSDRDRRFAVRDLESGVILLAPPVVADADIRRNAAQIALSADGRYLAVSVTDVLNTLTDLETGELTEIPAKWTVHNIGPGGRPVVVGDTLRLGLFAGGEVTPFTGDAWHTPGPVSADGTTLAYLSRALPENGGSTDPATADLTVTTADAVTGEVRTTVTVRDLASGLMPLGMGPWLTTTEVMVLARDLGARTAGTLAFDTYAINVTTGRTRELDAYSWKGWSGGIVLPGF